jgi:hypothetical protein
MTHRASGVLCSSVKRASGAAECLRRRKGSRAERIRSSARYSAKEKLDGKTGRESGDHNGRK